MTRWRGRGCGAAGGASRPVRRRFRREVTAVGGSRSGGGVALTGFGKRHDGVASNLEVQYIRCRNAEES